MKIAVQIFGHLRTYKSCYKSLHKHLLSRYDCDVFMHTWSTLNHRNKTWHKNHIGCDESASELESELKSLYSLKKLQIEDQVEQDLGTCTLRGSTTSIHGVKSMFRSMSTVNAMRKGYELETGERYDFVLMVRPDIMLLHDFDLESFLEGLDEAQIGDSIFTMCSPHETRISHLPFAFGTDLLFFARPCTIDKIYREEEKYLSFYQPGCTASHGAEGNFIKTVESIGVRPILINYLLGNDAEIVRFNSLKSIRKSIISIKARSNSLQLHLFGGLRFPLLRLQLGSASNFLIDLSLGKLYPVCRSKRKGRK